MLRMITHIYERRFFSVVDGGSKSQAREQRSGISQGCPLSPFLFVMLMSVAMKDAEPLLSPSCLLALQARSLDVVLYADDTLLIGSNESHLQEFLAAVATSGATYGMELHWSKFQLLQVNGSYQLAAPDGTAIAPSDLMTYLGASLYADGAVKSELNSKLGYAWAELKKLERLWKHTVLTTEKKIRILNGVIVPRVLYGLDTAWLNAAETRRLNGFYCRCLRTAMRIKPAFVSRVSNASVLQQAGQIELSRALMKRQLIV